ncbi:Putative cyclic nucleotide-gated ion channel 9 [Frankliniella fusca]|uniref:Cyclic nucleotide-gated ion channel 9 n=1 Tax=Frankliniella fusca TaxID=407009 RepID=A0AAE1HBM1_9NEOP|nr:Putative cyclic nucleotide-gated ion channel 9 [Frankliniella fusca]
MADWTLKTRNDTKRGRPGLEFCDLSESGKRKRTAADRASKCTEELVFSAQMALRKSGQRDAADFSKARQCKETPDPQPHALPPTESHRFSDDEALALIDQADLTKEQYIYIRTCMLAHGVDVLPCYDYVRRAKERCYPQDSESITVTESQMGISVQREGLFRQICRFSKAQMPQTSRFFGNGEYNQKPDEELTEGTIILTAAVPLQIIAQPENGPPYLLYQTDRPGSPRNCRPLRLLFRKETKEVVKEIKEQTQSQIDSLIPVQVVLESGKEVTIRHKAVLSMIDGKINSILCDTGAQNCTVCLAKPSMS